MTAAPRAQAPGAAPRPSGSRLHGGRGDTWCLCGDSTQQLRRWRQPRMPEGRTGRNGLLKSHRTALSQSSSRRHGAEAFSGMQSVSSGVQGRLEAGSSSLKPCGAPVSITDAMSWGVLEK